MFTFTHEASNSVSCWCKIVKIFESGQFVLGGFVGVGQQLKGYANYDVSDVMRRKRLLHLLHGSRELSSQFALAGQFPYCLHYTDLRGV